MTRPSTGPSYVPRGAGRRWPFVVGGPDAARRPPRSAHSLLLWGVLKALLGAQPTELRENWSSWPQEELGNFLRTPAAGAAHPSRLILTSLVRPGERVLDVGCGPGVTYETLAAAHLASGYVGVDSVAAMLKVARELFRGGDFRPGSALELVPQFGRESFDVVVVRHVLEHLPDFEAALREAIAVAGRLAVVIFFLTPRDLPFGVRKVDPGWESSFYNYIYSREAIEECLAQLGVAWRWEYNLGRSRAAWMGGEMNSVLIVSRDG